MASRSRSALPCPTESRRVVAETVRDDGSANFCDARPEGFTAVAGGGTTSDTLDASLRSRTWRRGGLGGAALI